MTVPSSVLVDCPVCGEETLHEVLSGRLEGKDQAVMESTVRCRKCGQVHHVVIRCERPIEIPVVISWLQKSVRSTVSLGPEEIVTVGDEMMCGETPMMITSIESKGSRPKRAKAKDVSTIWGKKYDKVRVPFSIGHHGRSHSEHVMAVPDEEFIIGDMLKIGKHEVVIHAIKLEDKVLRDGGASARDIVRVYATVVRKKAY
jgi:uncharacterized Zn finger protein